MKKKQRLQLKRKSKDFAYTFMNHVNQRLKLIEKFAPEIRAAIPDIFNAEDLQCEITISENNAQLMFLVSRGNGSRFQFKTYRGDVIDSLDVTDTWKNTRIAAFALENANGYFGSIGVVGGKPFQILGENTRITLVDTRFELPDGSEKVIEYGAIYSFHVFDQLKSIDIQNEIDNLFFLAWDSYRNARVRLSGDNISSQRDRLVNLASEMHTLFENFENDESVLDEFLTSNPIILERCLDIEPGSIISQTQLINLLKTDFDQNLIPDLICQNVHSDWLILDYKRSKRIVKRVGTARADVIAEVNDLKTQLKTYREYFDEDAHRAAFARQTNINISRKPWCIGVIGFVGSEERSTYRSGIEDLPGWLRLITYNEILTIFDKFIEELSLTPSR